ncbi:MAG TPA: hypothetical protein VGP33_08630, partial [Chloroflexota bacterium]|nr:hypothetical protein [Chloroflexota bacterium]
ATLIPAGHWQFRDVSLRFYLTARGLAEQQPADGLFAGSVQLAGYGVQRSGDQWFVALHWHAVLTLIGNRTVFVHAVDAAGNLVGQGDSPPDDGRLPTGAWTAGSDIYDLPRLSLPPSPGAYHLVIGWYDPATNRRMTLPSGADSVDLGPLP